MNFDDAVIEFNPTIDRILTDILGEESNYFNDDDEDDLIEIIRDTMHLLNLKHNKLRKIIRHVIHEKYKTVHIYNPDAQLNVLDSKDKIDSEQLIYHGYDYEHTQYKEKEFIDKMKRIEFLKSKPQPEQKSEEWLKLRMGCITATGFAEMLNEDPHHHPFSLILSKCRPEPFIEGPAVHHGKKYEEIANMYYGYRNNIKVFEYGLLKDDEIKELGASPDGICEKETMDGKLSKLVGRCLEIKCVLTRKLKDTGKLDGDICPHQYYLQMQVQMHVTGMNECDFLQCKIVEYDNYEEFIKDTHFNQYGLSKSTRLEKGVIIQLLPRNRVHHTEINEMNQCLYHAMYIYPPKLHMTFDEINQWIAKEIIEYPKNKFYNDYVIDKPLYWRIEKAMCHLVKYDAAFFASKIPIIKQFWKYVKFYRKYPEKLDDVIELAKDFGINKSDKIFRKIHADYSDIYYNDMKPLYQESNSWRDKFNKTEEFFAKRNKNH